MDTFSVTAAEADRYTVLPTRQSSSVFGFDHSLQDTPRSVTVIESNLMDLYGVKTVNDFVSVTAGTYTGNYFGVPGALTVRGASADNFFRGFRRVENRGNFPTVVGGTDYVEIIKGPPPPVYGGGKVGGILNFIPKTAKSKTAQYIEKPTGEVTATIGTYNKKIGTVEYGLPFSIFGKKSGAYFYSQIEDSDSFYRNVYNKGQLYQLSIDTELSDSARLEYGGMFQHADLNQSLGWNRVTQRMIDTDGEYKSGRPLTNLDTDNNGFISTTEAGSNINQFAFANPFPFTTAEFALNPATIRTVKLDHHTIHAESIDFSKTDAVTGFFDFIKDATPDMTLKNQSFYDSQNHTKYSSYGFSADYQEYVFENKTSMDLKTQPLDSLKLNYIAGGSMRYTEGTELEYRTNNHQSLDRRDIYLGASGNDRFPRAGTPGAGYYEWQQRGHFTDVGAFTAVDATYLDKLNFIFSGRMDNYDATIDGTSGTGVAQGTHHQSDVAGTYNGSVSYKVTPDLTPYYTHARSSFLELGQGGMIASDNIQKDSIIQKSTLNEVGLKTTALDKKLFATLALYRQQKTGYDTNANQGEFNTYTSKGAELEVRFAPSKQWSYTAAATVQETKVKNAPFLLGIPPAYLGLNPDASYAGRYFGDGSLVGLGKDLTVPIPSQVYSVGATYTNPSGWGAYAGETYVSKMYSGYLKQIVLPSYFVTNIALFYNYNNWSFRVNVKNIFDEKYYTPQALFEETFISPSQGPTADLTIGYKF